MAMGLIAHVTCRLQARNKLPASAAASSSSLKRTADDELPELPEVVGLPEAERGPPKKAGRHSRPMDLVIVEHTAFFQNPMSPLFTDPVRQAAILRSNKYYYGTRESTPEVAV